MESEEPAEVTVCEDGTASNQIRVKVVYYDALAVTGGLYENMGATAQDAEVDAESIKVRVGTTDVMTDSTGMVSFDHLTDASHELNLPDLHDSGGGAVYTTLETECGSVLTNDAAVPRHRTTYQVEKGALYTLRIWLRPNTIVIHWTVGQRRINDTVRSFYPFLIDGSGNHRFGGRVADDPRLWRHNLYMRGIPTNTIQGLSGNYLEVHRGLTSGPPRNEYYSWNSGKTATVAVNNVGYAKHAGGFNTNSVGISVCGMAGSTSANSPIGQTHAMTSAQIEGLVDYVAALCNAWHMDASDPNQVCTHFEVDYLHRNPGTENGKWDITWLPEDQQDDYRLAHSQELCATQVDPFDHTRHIDVAVGAGFASGNTNTDRVSAYLRDLIVAAM